MKFESYAILDNQPPNQTTMPTPSVYPGSSHPTSQRFNAELNSVPQEVRVMQHHIVYALGPNAVKMSCPTCHADIKTTTISDHQPSAHICCIVLCLLGWVIKLSIFNVSHILVIHIYCRYYTSIISNAVFYSFEYMYIFIFLKFISLFKNI